MAFNNKWNEKLVSNRLGTELSDRFEFSDIIHFLPVCFFTQRLLWKMHIKNTSIYQNFILIKWLVDYRKDPQILYILNPNAVYFWEKQFE